MAEQFHNPKPKIEPIEGIEPRHPVDKMHELTDIASPEKVKFDQALEKVDPSKVHFSLPEKPIQEAEAIQTKKSLHDIARETQTQVKPVREASKDTLSTAAASLHEKFQAPRATLISFDEKSIDIPSQPYDYKGALSSHVEHMDKALIDAHKIATGVEVESLTTPVNNQNPARKFLSFLTDADSRLNFIVSDIMSYSDQGKKLSPEKLLAIQVKLNFVQQEMEFFTNVLNRAVEGIKTLMNVQI